MPIDYKNYPTDWKTVIRPAILERDNNCCAFCNVENKTVYIIENGKQLFLERHKEMTHFYVCPDGIARWIGRHIEYHLKQVVLTIAHLDHDVNNNDYLNLKALCQRCHLSYDKEHHAKNAKETRKRKTRQSELL